MEMGASITEFMAENISIHDPNTQEVKPTSIRFERLFISEWSSRVVGVNIESNWMKYFQFEFLEGSMIN